MTGRGAALIVGATGTIGRGLSALLEERWVTTHVTSRNAGDGSTLILDLARSVDLAVPEDVTCGYIVAGVTSMQACAAEPQKTREVNVVNTLAVADRLARAGAHVVYVSTNLVLDGDTPQAAADETPGPQNEYAEQKLEVERSLLSLFPSAVLRISKLSESLLPLMQQWHAAMAEGHVIHPFSDLVCAPVATRQVLEALIRLGGRRSQGLFQLSGPKDWAYSSIAERLAERSGFETRLVQPRTSAEMGVELPACPTNTTLDRQTILDEFGSAPWLLQADEVDGLIDTVLQEA